MPRNQHLAKQKEEDDGPLSDDKLRLYHEICRVNTQDLVHDGAHSES